MKITLLTLFLLCAAVAFGQSTLGAAAINSQAQPVQFYSNPQHATHHPMAREESLLQSSSYTHARGERPLWEVARFPEEMPLGDIARALREDHEIVKKTDVIWINQ